MKYYPSIISCPFFLVTLAAALAAPTHGQTFTNGLIAFYPFNGTANDLSGNGNHGVASSVVSVPDCHGNADAAFLFAGNGESQVKLTNTSVFELTGDFTISAWIYFAGGTDNPRVFSTAGYEIGTQTTGAQRAFYVNTTGAQGGATVDSSSLFPAETWLHIVGRRLGSTIAIFGNGMKEGEVSSPAPDHSRGFVPEIGGNSGVGNDAFGGMIEDVRVYGRALSDFEIQRLYALEKRQRPSLTLSVRSIRVSLSVDVGRNYQLEASDDLTQWSPFGATFIAGTSIIEQDIDVLNGPQFFRIREVPPAP